MEGYTGKHRLEGRRSDQPEGWLGPKAAKYAELAAGAPTSADIEHTINMPPLSPYPDPEVAPQRSPEADAPHSAAAFYDDLAGKIEVVAARPNASEELSVLAANTRTLAAKSKGYIFRENDPESEEAVRKTIYEVTRRVVDVLLAPPPSRPSNVPLLETKLLGGPTTAITRGISDILGAPNHGSRKQQIVDGVQVDVFTKPTKLPELYLVSQIVSPDSENELDGHASWSLDHIPAEPDQVTASNQHLAA